MLTLASTNPKKYGFELQKLVLQHYKTVKKTIKALFRSNDFIIIERSALTTLLVFAKQYSETAILTEDQYQELTNQAKKLEIPYDIRILINTTPITCYKRIQLRNRDFETKNIKLEYLIHLDINHKEMYGDNLKEKTTLLINGNRSKEEVLEEAVENIKNQTLK